ncbi:MAG: c-type cytochrome [Actinobacteria bacterium]|nr:c-type cytochrome [Actinomycetota bacterium]
MHRKHVWSLLLALAITTALVIGVAGCGGETTTTTAAPTETTAAPSGVDAAPIYAAKCAGCHGAGGEGGAGPDLRALTDAAAVEAQVTTGGGAMPAFGDTLSAEDITALGTFVIDLE